LGMVPKWKGSKDSIPRVCALVIEVFGDAVPVPVPEGRPFFPC